MPYYRVQNSQNKPAITWESFKDGVLSRQVGSLSVGTEFVGVDVGKQNDTNLTIIRVGALYTKLTWLTKIPAPAEEDPNLPPPPVYTPPNTRKLRIWGEPVMLQYGFDYNIIQTSNWQNLKLWNSLTGWGAISNFLWIPNSDLRKLKTLQIPDTINYSDGSSRFYTQDNKMSWLCRDKGSIYFDAGDWTIRDKVKWGTTAVGGNWVGIEKTEVMTVPHPNDKTRKVSLEMAKLRCFRKTDWGRPLAELLLEGVVHRCYCVYKGNGFGDTPKGIVYSPLWSPLDWDFAGTAQPDGFWLPTDWMY